MTPKTGKVRLRLVKDLGGRAIKAGAVARLRLEDGHGSGVGREDARRMLTLPVGSKVEADPVELELAAGKWSVNVDLPGSGSLQDEFEIVADDTVDLDIEMAASPRESLNWQHYSGAVKAPRHKTHSGPAGPRIPEADIRSLVQDIFSKEFSQTGTLRRVTRALRGGDFSGLELQSITNGDDSPLESLDPEDFEEVVSVALKEQASSATGSTNVSVAFLREATDPVLWKYLADLKPSDASTALPQALQEVARKTRVPDDIYTVFEIAGDLGSAEQRHWALVEAYGECQLLALPAPWNVIDEEHGNTPPGLEILVRFLEQGRGMAELVVKDDTVSAMLGYMTSDKLNDAAVIADYAKDWLFHKHTNPFAAAGGGYVMLATRLHSYDTVWQRWIRNLHAKFGFLPDGAILEGAMCLNGPKEIRDFDHAAECFLTAYGRGLPYYTLGISWLRSGLSMLEADHPELREPAQAVASVARLVETNRPFVTLRLPPQSQPNVRGNE